MTIKKSLITTDWRAKGLKNPGTRSFRACFLLLILMMVCVAAVSAGATSISPISGSQYGGTIVTITGTFTTTATPSVNFSAGAYDAADSKAATVTAYTATTITATTPGHATGLVNVIVNNAGDMSTLSGAFTYTGAGPTSTGGMNVSANTTAGSATYYSGFDSAHNVEMKYIKTAAGSLVNLSGSNIKAPYYVTFGGTQNLTSDFVGLTVNNVDGAAGAGDGFNLTMMARPHAAGQVSVVLTTPNGTTAWTNLTYVAVPVITGISPAYGTSFGGDTITITGTGDFGSASSVYFNNTAATILTKNATAVTVTSPYANLYITPINLVNITTVGGDSTKVTVFTYYDPPAIDATSAPAGQTYATSPFNVTILGGTTVTIYGKNFTTAAMSGATVKFNGTAATSVTRTSDTVITAVAPAWPYMTVNTLWQSGNFINIQNSSINVTTLGGTSNNNLGNITYDILKPNVTSVSPTSGSTGGGNVVTITGKNLSYASKVYFFNPAAPSNLVNTTAGVTVVSDTQITCIVPASTMIGAVTINVTTPAGFASRSPDTTTAQYTYSANIPSITTVSPTFGPDTGLQWVNITGTGFSGYSSATFNGVAVLNSYVFNDTQITLQTPAYPLGGVSFIAVSAAGGSVTQQNAYTFAGIPHITSISPAAGSVAGGSSITITGTNLTRASVVRFNVTQATIVGTPTATSVSATLPAANGSATGPVNVNVTTWLTSDTTDATGSNAFNYGSGPTLTSISPVSGAISGGTLVTLKGANLANATSVTFGGIPATNFTRFDAGNQITANTPSTTTPGLVNPLIITPAGSVTNASVGYTYYGSPVITSVSPSGGSIAGNTFVTITGTSFVGASQVTFDGIQATNFTYISDTKITANTPAHAAGVVNVLVAATGGTGTSTYTYRTTTATAVGVWRSGTFYLNGGTPVSYGLATDTPITGVWTAGSTTNVGVFRSGTFYLNGGTPVSYGLATDKPITGVWTAGSTTNVGVFRSGTFYLNGGTPVSYGLATDTPVTGDWNGDGITEVGVFRSGMFYLNGVTTPVAYGLATDTPITGDWNADGITEVGVFRSGTFYLNGVTTPVAYGLATDTPITGKWV